MTLRLRVVLVILALGTIGCDRVTKHAAVTNLSGIAEQSFLNDTVRLSYHENTGGFLSLGAHLPKPVRTAIFTVGTGLALVWFAWVAFDLRFGNWAIAGVMLFLAGGASNWIDRVRHGSVVDFLNVGIGPLRTGIFNVADVALMTGATIVVWTEARRVLRARRAASATKS